jgi:hypothetical protein
MANPARDIRERVQQQWPGATVVGRGRASLTHQHPQYPARKMLDATIGPLHIAGTETEIDTAWQPTAGAWQYEMTLADYQAYARSVLNAGDTVQYVDPGSGQSVTFQPLSLNWVNSDNSRQQIAQPGAAAAVVADDTLRWVDGYGAGRHFSWQTQTTRLQKLLTVDSLANLPAPAAWLGTGELWLELEFIIKNSTGVELYLDGARWTRTNNLRVRTADRIEFRSLTTGAVLWYLAVPRAWDAAGGEVVGQYEVRKQGGAHYITVRVPRAWLLAAAYPVYVDPTIDTQGAAGANDGIAGADGTFDAAIDLNMLGRLSASANFSSFYRWAGITISGTIDVAYIEIASRKSQGTPLFRLYGVDADNPNAPTNLAAYNNAALTTAYADWTTNWSTTKTFHQSPSLAAIFQELVDTYTISNDAVMVQVRSTATVNNNYGVGYFYENAAADAAKLHIEYTEGGGGTDALTANGITTGAPTLGAPTLTQNAVTHNLTATAITAGTPTLGQPAIGQVHVLSGAATVAGSPELGTPAIGQSHVLTATAIATGAPAVGSPAVGQAHVLTAAGIAAAAPELGAPAIGQIHALIAVVLDAQAPALGAPAIGQVHALTATGIVTGAPVLGAPSMEYVPGTDALTAAPITAGAPVVGSPALGQIHALTAEALTAGQPALDAPELVQIVALTAVGITAGAPQLTAPAIGQVHALTASGIVTGAPEAGQPAIGQVHVLVAALLLAGAPVLGAPYLFLGQIVTPAERVYTIRAENRTYTVAAENRTFVIAAENRTYTVRR